MLCTLFSSTLHTSFRAAIIPQHMMRAMYNTSRASPWYRHLNPENIYGCCMRREPMNNLMHHTQKSLEPNSTNNLRCVAHSIQNHTSHNVMMSSHNRYCDDVTHYVHVGQFRENAVSFVFACLCYLIITSAMEFIYAD